MIEEQEFILEKTPTQMATVWVQAYNDWVCVGQVKKTTAKNIWIDTTYSAYYFRKGVIRFILRKNGQYESDGDGSKHWLYFHSDPLVKFLSNGL